MVSVAESGGNRLEITGIKRIAEYVYFKRGMLRPAEGTVCDGYWEEKTSEDCNY